MQLLHLLFERKCHVIWRNFVYALGCHWRRQTSGTGKLDLQLVCRISDGFSVIIKSVGLGAAY